MQKFILLILMFVGLGCGNTNDAKTNPQPGSDKENATKIQDNSVWFVSTKMCNAQVLPHKDQRIMFQKEFLVYVSRISEDENSYCNQGKVYSRIVQEFSNNGAYYEKSQLRPEGIKVQCYDKRTTSVISSKEEQLNESSEQVVELTLKPEGSSVAWVQNSSCPNGLLTLHLKTN